MRKLVSQPKKRSLTDVMLETLSIIAYKQPVTKQGRFRSHPRGEM